ncbi:hypothetical protein [Myxococcus sp. Y35]|uniref:hypothetical protein n=1 Tax=Pseudomyxococcus flavus TaxID=3115648 RepID=UPI003CF0E95C
MPRAVPAEEVRRRIRGGDERAIDEKLDALGVTAGDAYVHAELAVGVKEFRGAIDRDDQVLYRGWLGLRLGCL